ncbi:MAG: hypothetical protein ACOYXW_00405 [Actinomycetota bacterium]
MRRLLLPALAGLLALAGIVAVAVGIAQRTVWLPDDEVTATARLSPDVPLAVTEPGVLEMRDGPVTVTVTAEADDAPVVIAVGRQGDVEAWVDGAAHSSVGGLVSERRLRVETVDGQTEVPDPGTTSDLWLEQETGTGGVTYVYDPPPGAWLLLAATNGTVPGPTELTFTWPREVTTPWSVPLIVIGAVLLLGGIGLLAWLWQRGRPARVRPATVPERTEVHG